MQEILPKLIGVFGAVFLFGFAIFVHELGHFLVAKISGVGVSKFAIGMGPKIWSFVRGETEYSLRWIPIGGFVALKGMIDEGDEKEDAKAGEKSAGADDAEKPKEEKESGSMTEDLDALRNKHPLIRIAVFGAGVTCNYITAMVVMVLVLWYGNRPLADLPNVLEKVPETSYAYEVGWRTGDAVVGVEWMDEVEKTTKTIEVAHWNDLEASMSTPASRFKGWQVVKRKLGLAEDAPSTVTGQTLVATVERNGERLRLLLPPQVQRSAHFMPALPAMIYMLPTPNSAAGRARMVKDNYTPGEKIQPYPNWDEMEPVALEQGDTILAVDDNPVNSWGEMREQLEPKPQAQVNLTIKREGRVMLLTTRLDRNAQGFGVLGVWQELPRKGERVGLPFFEALKSAPIATLALTDTILYQTIKLFKESSGSEIQKQLGGPVAITVLSYKSAQRGLAEYLSFFIAINLILAIMNLLPIPILDGGYIAITILETIIRRPISPKILMPLMTFFMILFLILFGYLFFNDFMNLFYKH